MLAFFWKGKVCKLFLQGPFKIRIRWCPAIVKKLEPWAPGSGPLAHRCTSHHHQSPHFSCIWLLSLGCHLTGWHNSWLLIFTLCLCSWLRLGCTQIWHEKLGYISLFYSDIG
jgi:hypothetical protein